MSEGDLPGQETNVCNIVCFLWKNLPIVFGSPTRREYLTQMLRTLGKCAAITVVFLIGSVQIFAQVEPLELYCNADFISGSRPTASLVDQLCGVKPAKTKEKVVLCVQNVKCGYFTKTEYAEYKKREKEYVSKLEENNAILDALLKNNASNAAIKEAIKKAEKILEVPKNRFQDFYDSRVMDASVSCLGEVKYGQANEIVRVSCPDVEQCKNSTVTRTLPAEINAEKVFGGFGFKDIRPVGKGDRAK